MFGKEKKKVLENFFPVVLASKNKNKKCMKDQKSSLMQSYTLGFFPLIFCNFDTINEPL